MANELIHVLGYGEPGAGKSTFAATFPKPMLVMAFDPYGKDGPYLRKGVADPIAEAVVANDGSSKVSVPCRVVRDKKTNKEIIKIAYFHDVLIKQPNAYSKYLLAMSSTPHVNWKTIVIDSVTFMELAARKEQQYKLNPTSKDPRQWWAGATDSLEEQLMMSLGGIETNVVVLAHIDKDKDEVRGNYVSNPAAPGRLRGRLASAFAEFYRVFVGVDEDGVQAHLLQTKPSSEFNAHSQIGAPNPCLPYYSALWSQPESE